MRGPSARREFGFVLVLAVTGIALVVLVAFAPWYPTVDAPADVGPSLWQQMTIRLSTGGSVAPMP
ncbi:MAG TPA: hypothetical protein VFG35_16855 [Actinoplanes sp.]|nr:hypothetical protein [Actinoplanes sp.]